MRTKVIAFLTIYCCSLVICRAQTLPFNCGTDMVNPAPGTFGPQTAQSQNKSALTASDDSTLYTVPVVFIIYHLGEAVGTGSNLSDALIMQQLDALNQSFKGGSVQFPGPDAKIQFKLVQKTPSCTPTNGIIRVDARSVPGYEQSGIQNFSASTIIRISALPQSAV